ncbi:MAG: carbohydrate ABC transporter permease [Geodermatophilaceae bacterium]|nr:carbohydrate ABC transporter permease [Geodermatophilaceae bacterium]
MSTSTLQKPGTADELVPVRPGESNNRRVFTTSLTYAMLLVIAIVYIFPFLLQIITSFKTDGDAASNPISLIPATWSTATYQTLFGGDLDFPLWTMNSVIVTVCVTIGRVFFCSLAGYALARLHFRGRGVMFALLIAVMAVPGVVLLIPKFLVVNQIGLYDSYAGMIVPLLVDAAGIFIMRNFFESIPVSVEEAARIDGAGIFRTFWSVVLPMARPALVVLTILSFQGSWNELSHFVVTAQSAELYTLTKGVATLAAGGLGQAQQFPLKLGAAALMTIPVAVLFFIFQRQIMSTAEGAEKG